MPNNPSGTQGPARLPFGMLAFTIPADVDPSVTRH